MQDNQNSTGASTYVAESSNFRASDLQVAKLGTNFAMAHKMGLVVLDMTTGKSVTETRTMTYDTNTRTTDATCLISNSANTTTIYPCHEFNTSSGYTGTLLNASTSGKDCYYIVKCSPTVASSDIKVGCISTERKEFWDDVNVGAGLHSGECVSRQINSNRTFANLVALFSYVNTIQTITLPWYGEYKMECWGASGGSNRGLVTDMGNRIDTNGKMDSGVGGLGGYSIGTITYAPKNTQALFICVGGKGIQAITRKGATPNVSANGGYNGGGQSFTADKSGDNYMGTGGGATHIATRTGVLSSLKSYQSSVLIVAGGGGGSAYYRNTNANYHVGLGGHGGGTTAGSARNAYEGTGGALTSPGGGQSASSGSSFIYGTFGQGANMTAAYGSGGGGGWYGGATHNCGWGAGGGSGHIGTGVSGNTYNGDSTNRPTNPGGNDGYAKITSQ